MHHRGIGASPQDKGKATAHNGHRKELKNIDTPRHGIPSIARQPPTATKSPWSSSYASGGLPPSTGNTFFDDTSDDIQLSPGNRRLGTDDSPHRYNRRPSIASANTVSSTGSKSDGKYHKKLNGFFGDDFPGDSRSAGDSVESFQYPPVTESAPIRKKAQAGVRNHNGSGSSGTRGGSADGRPGSPAIGRPWTPQTQPKPSSEVTPWEFQVCGVLHPFFFSFFFFSKRELLHFELLPFSKNHSRPPLLCFWRFVH